MHGTSSASAAIPTSSTPLLCPHPTRLFVTSSARSIGVVLFHRDTNEAIFVVRRTPRILARLASSLCAVVSCLTYLLPSPDAVVEAAIFSLPQPLCGEEAEPSEPLETRRHRRETAQGLQRVTLPAWWGLP